MTVHFDTYDAELPDAGNGQCCMGAAVYGPGRCTCWERVNDIEQQPTTQGPHNVRSEMCHDCAFRIGSPERTSDTRYAHAGELEELPTKGTFYCHQGMAKTIALVHVRTGIRHELPADVDAYNPGDRFTHPCKADGTPADVCAGFWAQRKSRRDQ